MKYTDKQSAFRAIAALAVIGTLAACQAPAGPEQVAGDFWQAWQAGDLDKARGYCSAASAAKLVAAPAPFAGAQVRFERLVIEGNQASVDTVATFPAPPGAAAAPDPRHVMTYLVREEDRWRVDAARTQVALAPDAGVQELARRIEALGQELARGVEGVGKNIERELPELQRKLGELGERTEKQIDEALTELRRQLDEALKPETPQEPKGKEI